MVVSWWFQGSVTLKLFLRHDDHSPLRHQNPALRAPARRGVPRRRSTAFWSAFEHASSTLSAGCRIAEALHLLEGASGQGGLWKVICCRNRRLATYAEAFLRLVRKPLANTLANIVCTEFRAGKILAKSLQSGDGIHFSQKASRQEHNTRPGADLQLWRVRLREGDRAGAHCCGSGGSQGPANLIGFFGVSASLSSYCRQQHSQFNSLCMVAP